jgi:hypothetical protein
MQRTPEGAKISPQSLTLITRELLFMDPKLQANILYRVVRRVRPGRNAQEILPPTLSAYVVEEPLETPVWAEAVNPFEVRRLFQGPKLIPSGKLRQEYRLEWSRSQVADEYICFSDDLQRLYVRELAKYAEAIVSAPNSD